MRTPEERGSTVGGEGEAPPNVVLGGAAVAVLIASLLIWIPARGHVQRATYGDGELYRYVAQHLASSRSQVAPLLESRGVSVRYGRIGLPALLWLLSGGSHRAMFYVQPLLMIVFAAVAGGATAFLVGGPPSSALAPFVSLGFATSISGGFADGMAVALALASLALARKRQWLLATATMSAALLAKEGAFVALAGVLIWHLLRRDWSGIWVGTAVIPYVAWGVFVANRFGQFPLLDPYLKNQTLGKFAVALMKTLEGGGSAAFGAGVHVLLGAAAIVLLLNRRSLLSLIAVLASVQILATAPVVWQHLADGFRSTSFQEVFLTLTALAAFKDSKGYVSSAVDSDASARHELL